jgi:hypothetical protein
MTMDEIQLLRDFRAELPTPSPDARRSARLALVARTGESRARRWFRGRRRAVVIAVAALAAVVAVGAALGLGDRVLDLVRGKPASPSAQRIFAKMFDTTTLPEPYKTRVAGYQPEGEWRGILGLTTSIGPLGLWAAPTHNGGICFTYAWLDKEITHPVFPAAGGDCEAASWHQGDPWPQHDPLDPARIEAKIWPAGRPAVRAQINPYGYGLPMTPGDTRATTAIVQGRAAAEVARVEIVFRDGGARRVPVYDTFFATEVPRGRVVQELVPLGARGQVLAHGSCVLSPGSQPPQILCSAPPRAGAP